MSLLNYFRRKRKPSAGVAKERLQIIFAHEYAANRRHGPDYLPELKKEILAVVGKYVNIDPASIKVNLERDGDCEILELNIALPEDQEVPA